MLGVDTHNSILKSLSTVLIPRIPSTQIMEGVTHVLQQHKEVKVTGGSATLCFAEKHFHAHAVYLDFFPYVVLHFPNSSSYDKQGNLNQIKPQQLHLIP